MRERDYSLALWWVEEVSCGILPSRHNLECSASSQNSNVQSHVRLRPAFATSESPLLTHSFFFFFLKYDRKPCSELTARVVKQNGGWCPLRQPHRGTQLKERVTSSGDSPASLVDQEAEGYSEAAGTALISLSHHSTEPVVLFEYFALPIMHSNTSFKNGTPSCELDAEKFASDPASPKPEGEEEEVRKITGFRVSNECSELERRGMKALNLNKVVLFCHQLFDRNLSVLIGQYYCCEYRPRTIHFPLSHGQETHLTCSNFAENRE
ncbi:hypothetical protein MPH_09507 [Macrophomina phaseolina MS6]|uniref:Uncharacterized protein n=1 Tax=Macrophomina phaseolina (strain MS6) TaxID=1126212 RepID=K2RK65_MACPH|nr:hypothetical protein MPH_09507 [Macrophomina phaseolina MS6]